MERISRGNMWQWRKTAGLLVAIFAQLLWVLVLDCPAACALSEDAGIKVYCNDHYQGSTAFIDSKSGVALVPLALMRAFRDCDLTYGIIMHGLP